MRDEHGQKMSKTKGNVVDPLTVDKIGVDAFRFTLVALAAQGEISCGTIKELKAM